MEGRLQLLPGGGAGERLRVRGGSGGLPASAAEGENGVTGL
jgi:hypothetical protein